MKKSIYIYLTILFISTSISAQEKIGNKIYLYGDLENSVNGKTLVYYGVNDPKGESKIIKRFVKKGVNAISWNKVFIPGYKYSDSEMNSAINKKNIETIILIKLNSKSSYSQSYSSTSYSNWTDSFNTYGTSGSVVGNVGLLFEIYTKRDGFDKPLAVINGNANNSWGVAGSQRGVTLKVVKRVLDAMKDGKAFEINENNENKSEDNYSELITDGNYINKGFELQKRKEYADAIVSYSKHLENDENNTDALFLRAMCKTELNDRYGAIKDYDRIIELEKSAKPRVYKMSTVYNNKAYCLINLKEYDEALPIVTKALEMDKSEAYIWDTRGELYYHIGEYEKSIKDMDKAINIQKNANSYYFRGLANLKLKNKSKACADFSIAGELGETKAYKEITENCN